MILWRFKTALSYQQSYFLTNKFLTWGLENGPSLRTLLFVVLVRTFCPGPFHRSASPRRQLAQWPQRLTLVLVLFLHAIPLTLLFIYFLMYRRRKKTWVAQQLSQSKANTFKVSLVTGWRKGHKICFLLYDRQCVGQIEKLKYMLYTALLSMYSVIASVLSVQT